MDEPFLEPVLRFMRINKVLPVIRDIHRPRLLDIGCGWDARFLRNIERYVYEAVGIDFKAPELNNKKIQTISSLILDQLPFEDSSFDIVTMLAVLEHISNPLEISREISRVLRGRGLLVLTVPTKPSKLVLEFLSYRLGIVNPEEIRDHKKYYNLRDISELFLPCGFKIQKHEYFQFYMNNFCVMEKVWK
jgi:ubiquinone/menaquinone biosynthesis C-methylase UbiE